jgi:hypothetical protein
MSSLYIHLADATEAIQGAVDGVATWHGSPTQVGLHSGRGALAAIDQALRFLALARGELLNEVSAAAHQGPTEYDRLLAERYPVLGYQLVDEYVRREDVASDAPAPDLPEGVEGQAVGRAPVTRPFSHHSDL